MPLGNAGLVLASSSVLNSIWKKVLFGTRLLWVGVSISKKIAVSDGKEREIKDLLGL